MYTGSLTTPPCTVGVYFQVVDRVLPISKKHYDAYKKHQSKYVQRDFFDPTGAHQVVGSTTYNEYAAHMGKAQYLDVTGNWRITNMVDNHGVVYMRDDLKKVEPAITAEIALGVLLGVTVLVFIILVACACK